MSCNYSSSLDGFYSGQILANMMNIPIKLYLLVNGIIAATGTLLMRYGGKNLDFTQGICYIVTSGYLWILGMILSWIAGMFFALLLTRYGVTESFSLYVPLVYLMIICGGLFFLHETLSITRGVGVLFVFIGLIFLLK